jgi:hypothetical protein
MPPAGIFTALCIKRTNNLADFPCVVNHHNAMRHKTINNALIALRKQGGTEGKLAEVLHDMRGVHWSGYTQHGPLKRGESKRIILAALKEGPMTNTELGSVIRQYRPDITPRAAANRSYQALLRLKDAGMVVQGVGPDGCLWRIR